MTFIGSSIQRRIHNNIKGLLSIPVCEIKASGPDENDLDQIFIKFGREFIPDFRLQWDTRKEQYRVYIWVASTSQQKTEAGYPICTIRNPLDVAEFNTMVNFLYRRRPNNRLD